MNSKILAQNYAVLSNSAIVTKVFENPGLDFVSKYNAENSPRVYACPIEVKVGWFRKNGQFFPPSLLPKEPISEE